MFINEFHSRLRQEKSRLFDALRRVSRLEKDALLAGEEPGWVEWPPLCADGLGLVKA
jgi:hypothetical protein